MSASAPLSAFKPLETERFILRPLQEADVTQRYLSWFSTPGASHLTSSDPQTLDSLRAYVAEKQARSDVLFLGLFNSADGCHIGNLKYEPVDAAAQEAVMGIFVGEPSYQGKGVAGEVIAASAQWLKTHAGIARIVLGVYANNLRARRSYEKLGFAVGDTTRIPAGDAILPMIWEIP